MTDVGRALEELERAGLALARLPGAVAVLANEDFSPIWRSDLLEEMVNTGGTLLERIHPDDMALLGDVMSFHSSASQEQVGDGWRPQTAALRVLQNDGSYTLMDFKLFNMFHVPGVEALMIIGTPAVDRSGLGEAIDLIADGAPVIDVVEVIEAYIHEAVQGIDCQIVWWDGTELNMAGKRSMSVSREVVNTVRQSGEPTDVEQGDAVDTVVPISSASGGAVIGAAIIHRDGGRPLVLGPQQPIHQGMRLASLAIVNQNTDASSKWEEQHDASTGLVNRIGLSRAMADLGGDCSMMLVRLTCLDELAQFGTSACRDSLIAETARRIARCARPGDVVARSGRSEFAVLCPGVMTGAIAEARAEELGAAVAEPIVAGEAEVELQSAVGVAFATSIADQVSLLRRAGEAVERAVADSAQAHVA